MARSPPTAAVTLVCGSLALLAAATERKTPDAAPQDRPAASYVTSAQLAEKLRAAIATAADPALAPIAVTGEYSIHEVHRQKAGPPAVHSGWTELHFILDGSATFVTGGTLTAAPGGAGSAIEGGVTRKVSKGDAVLVPSDTPHWYKEVDGSLTYLEVRFRNPGGGNR
jgi:mannose-6-phosphate isomerase-like protein (cupin superfamily)